MLHRLLMLHRLSNTFRKLSVTRKIKSSMNYFYILHFIVLLVLLQFVINFFESHNYLL